MEGTHGSPLTVVVSSVVKHLRVMGVPLCNGVPTAGQSSRGHLRHWIPRLTSTETNAITSGSGSRDSTAGPGGSAARAATGLGWAIVVEMDKRERKICRMTEDLISLEWLGDSRDTSTSYKLCKGKLSPSHHWGCWSSGDAHH